MPAKKDQEVKIIHNSSDQQMNYSRRMLFSGKPEDFPLFKSSFMASSLRVPGLTQLLQTAENLFSKELENQEVKNAVTALADGNEKALNNLLYSLIFQDSHTDVYSLISTVYIPFGNGLLAWMKLLKHYEKGNKQTKLKLLMDLFSSKCKTRTDFPKFMHELTRIRARLQASYNLALEDDLILCCLFNGVSFCDDFKQLVLILGIFKLLIRSLRSWAFSNFMVKPTLKAMHSRWFLLAFTSIV